ncbi:30S ribosomal protein S2 [Planctomycetota bacterium]
MTRISIKQLIESGVHFGHSTSRWNPKMARFIYGKRNAIHIIDLRETIKGLLQACAILKKMGERGQDILLVGTKKAAREAVKGEANRAEVPWATERWLGGTFTNFKTIKSRVQRLNKLEELNKTGEISNYSKKVIAKYNREQRKLLRNLGGIRDMNKLPELLIVVDPRREKSAVAEANRLDIPVIALTDTDCDPDRVDVVIPGNDDALRSVKCIIGMMMDSFLEGNKKRKLSALPPTKIKEKPTATPEKSSATPEKPAATPEKSSAIPEKPVVTPAPTETKSDAKTGPTEPPGKTSANG